MTTGDGWTSQFLAGLAQYLHDNGIGVYRPTGAYTAGEIAITLQDIPPEPDRLITVSAYPVPSPAGMQDVTVGVQFRLRGTTDPFVCQDIYDAIYELLDGAANITLGDIKVSDVSWRSHAPLGKDANLRWEASTNFYFAAMRRTPNRTD